MNMTAIGWFGGIALAVGLGTAIDPKALIGLVSIISILIGSGCLGACLGAIAQNVKKP